MASFCFIIALGLHLTLFIEQPEYIGLLTHESGVRVAIHANDIFPYPEDVGLSASTGQSTAIGVRQVRKYQYAENGMCFLVFVYS